MKPRWCWVALSVLAWPGTAAAQRASAGATLQTYSFSDVSGVKDVQVTTMPVDLTWSRGPLQVAASSAFARGILTRVGGGYSEVSGITDTRVGVTYGWRRLQLRGFAVLPTGESRYAAEDLPLIGTLSSGMLPFAIDGWGSGGGLGGLASIGGRRGDWLVWGTGAYGISRAYTPFEGDPGELRPGDQLSGRLTVRRRVGDGGLLDVEGSVQYFANDHAGGARVYRSGFRWGGRVAFATPLGAREAISVFAAITSRAAGSIPTLGPGASPPIAGVVGSEQRLQLVAGAEGRVARDRLALVPQVGLRLMDVGEASGSGWLLSLGGRAEYRLGGGRLRRHLVAAPFARVHLGSFDVEPAGRATVRGWELGASLVWETGQ